MLAVTQTPSRVATRRAVETRQYMAVVEHEAYDYGHDRLVWVPEVVGPFPVLVGPGEPYRVQAAAMALTPEGYHLTRWYPVGAKEDYCINEEF